VARAEQLGSRCTVMTSQEFRALAMELPSVIEASHQGHGDFRVRGKIFATLGYPDTAWGMVRLEPEDQARRVQTAPAVFVPAKGVWGEQGSTLVKLEAATLEFLRPAMRAAWQRLVTEETGRPPKKKIVKRRTARARTPTKRA